MRRRVILALGLAASGGCRGTETQPTAAPGTTRVGSSPRTAAPAACRSDTDCHTCESRRGCLCLLAPSAECGPSEHPCFVAPCSFASASCWDGRCVVRPAASSDCATDADCEVRDDECACDIFPALRSAPVVKNRCPGHGCGGRPSKSQWRARCDTGLKRCMLERAN